MKKDKKYTMLIVDDEPIISDGLKDLFEESFGDIFSICNCYHPKRALEIFKYRLPDVVVSDVRMPKMTGIEMAEKMRSVKQDIHVLFCLDMTNLTMFILLLSRMRMIIF